MSRLARLARLAQCAGLAAQVKRRLGLLCTHRLHVGLHSRLGYTGYNRSQGTSKWGVCEQRTGAGAASTVQKRYNGGSRNAIDCVTTAAVWRERNGELLELQETYTQAQHVQPTLARDFVR